MKTINMAARVIRDSEDDFAYENVVTWDGKTIKEEYGYTDNSIYVQGTIVKGGRQPDDVVRAEFT